MKMRKGTELTVECFVEYENGDVKPLNDLTEEERKAFDDNVNRRLSRTLSQYFSLHTDEYAKLCGA